MTTRLLQCFRPERVGWFGAGVSAAAVGLAGYELAVAPLLPSPAAVAAAPRSEVLVLAGASHPTATPWPTRTPWPTATPWPTRPPAPTRTPRPSWTPTPTRTPRPTRTAWPTATPRPRPTPWPTRASLAPAPDLLATATIGDPDRLAAAVATFASRAGAGLDSLRPTPGPT